MFLNNLKSNQIYKILAEKYHIYMIMYKKNYDLFVR